MSKVKKRITKLLALLTVISLIKYSINDEEYSIIQVSHPAERTLKEGTHIEIVTNDGIVYPSILDNFKNSDDNAFATMPIAIYDSYKENKEMINSLDIYESMKILYTNDNLSYISTRDGKKGYVYNACIEILPDNYIETDISMQKVFVFSNKKEIFECDVVTGKPGTDTDIGYTEVLSKTYHRPLIGPGYRLDVKCFIHFNNSEEGFHDNYKRKEFGKDIYLTNGSHGCVNMSEESVDVLDMYSNVGTKVLVHK